MRTGRRVLALLLLAGLALLPAAALAQSLTFDMGAESGTNTGRIIELVALFTVLSLAPGILIAVTSFTRIIIVLSLLRTALGIQGSPPNMVLISLALFLTAFIMAPTLQRAYDDGVHPLIEERISEADAFERTVKPFHDFMMAHVRERDLALFMSLGKLPQPATPDDTPFRALLPGFLVSELTRAFEIGFLLYLPFLVIDVVVASLVMSMGMASLPPSIISLPFKLIFFVMIDGWYMVCGSLIRSFGPG